MKNLSQHITESFQVNESWPFSDKKHITRDEEIKLSKYAEKNDILQGGDSNSGYGTVNDKRFQTNNEEKAWELFEIIVATGRKNDYIKFAVENTWISQDELFSKNPHRALNEITDIMVKMMKNRSADDVKILKKMKILI